MAAPHTTGGSPSPDTLITIKISVNDQLKKLKLPLRDLGAHTLPRKLRSVLDIKPEQTVLLERYSDSAGGYITLDESNPQVFKTLIRAAKAKLKLRLKATVSPVSIPVVEEEETLMPKMPEMNPIRDSTALDQRSIGSGIFQFKEARASQQTLVNDEAPVPRPFTADRSSILNGLALPSQQSLAFRPREPSALSAVHPHAWSVYCNECDKAMANEHFHCSICDGGDYDLCEECVSGGKLCPGEGHWLVKRYIQNGKVISSTTERVQPRKVNIVPAFIKQEPVEKDIPGAFTEETKTLAEDTRTPTRTCNSCVIVLPEREFVTCTTCDDFDLCIKCHTSDKHGHHPAHGFEPSTAETILPLAAETKLAPGRNVRHNAICDGCDKKIYGIRHKCLNCPDWDYCSDCVKDARHSHPRHRFAALYEPIADQGQSAVRHFGIYCDGPLCSGKSDQSYIAGVRYKCTICHDTDFCAGCEALPGNHHNRTHPLIKLKTPVRNVNVSTENEDLRGNVRVMGDRRASPVSSTGTETSPIPQANAATQVQTVADFQPTEVKKETMPISIPVKTFEQKGLVPEPAAVPSTLLNAHFVRDSIPDGMAVDPEARFTQIWTLKNPGPYVWPAGCSVRYVGGDNMLNVDNSHPASVTAIADATESNVVGRDVQIGEEVAFKVVLKAPVREGKSISYWRLKAADGTPFGHRLWCDIEVKKAEQKTPSPSASIFQEQQIAMQRMRIQQMQMLRVQQQAAREQTLRFNAMAAQQAQNIPAEQPPAYDSMGLSARLAAMREQQKQRREQMVAQRDQLQAQGNTYCGQRSAEFSNEKERREALKQRVAHIKANIIKTREEREKMTEDFQQLKMAAAEKKSMEESEKVQNIIEQVAKQADEEEKTEQLEGSQMVFPKLEKESPSSSTYESATSSSSKGKAAYVENEEGEVERSATPATAPISIPISSPSADDDFVDLDEELEVLSANGNDSEDDGFLTDEEYDILDASDQETVVLK
ncbi:uncharacterized protein CLAFUR5_04242 [Fulvia fulva]|uniref:ZZ-type domain-containing protein n=1 Tax=Passalora fulva TaxID=5499 RepID=A0A9Q8P829_PASFU|nr:uncharacterized protein CLAFUR5_04242 [Fulvia fulva]KAK4628323.1 hypothetical protein CLAFUR0_04265 [Fulvia fulva]UJO16755.1 hypothetical protein CLAFUR5_04242 [Fulvia fulva]WPV29003.1 hypothetical protein CLAFUW7_04266 [Fulvia fulva]